MEFETEIWKDVVGFEKYFQISNFGNVLSKARKVWNGKGFYNKSQVLLKPSQNHKGYPIAYLGANNEKRTIPIHRLVAIAFIPNPNNLPQVNHIDGNKQNNRVDNLEWCTNSDNQLHAWKMGLQRVSGNAGKPKRAVLQYDKDWNLIHEYPSIADASRAVGEKSKSNIGECCRGRKKSVQGYYWKFKKEVV